MIFTRFQFHVNDVTRSDTTSTGHFSFRFVLAATPSRGWPPSETPLVTRWNKVSLNERQQRGGFKGSGSYLGQLLGILGLLADERHEIREGVVTVLGVLDHPRGGRVLWLVIGETGHTLTGTTGQSFVRRVQPWNTIHHCHRLAVVRPGGHGEPPSKLVHLGIDSVSRPLRRRALSSRSSWYHGTLSIDQSNISRLSTTSETRELFISSSL